MKKSTKVILLTMCAVALVVGTLFGTLAYLTDTEAVTNTMTVGKVGLSLDEAKVNEYGEALDASGNKVTEIEDAKRVVENDYKLIPGCTYTKDPIVHVDADSEDSYIFVKIVNEIAAIEADTKIEAQLLTNGWTKLVGVDGVYYQVYTKNQADKNLEVFENFTIAGTVDNNTLATYAGKTIVVTAYAVQKAGFDTAEAAWDATFGASSNS